MPDGILSNLLQPIDRAKLQLAKSEAATTSVFDRRLEQMDAISKMAKEKDFEMPLDPQKMDSLLRLLNKDQKLEYRPPESEGFTPEGYEIKQYGLWNELTGDIWASDIGSLLHESYHGKNHNVLTRFRNGLEQLMFGVSVYDIPTTVEGSAEEFRKQTEPKYKENRLPSLFKNPGSSLKILLER